MQKRLDLGRFGRQADQRIGNPANQVPPPGWRCRAQALGGKPGENPPVDRAGLPVGRRGSGGQRRWFAERLQRPPVQSGAALCDRFRPSRPRCDPFAQLLSFVSWERRPGGHLVGQNSSDQQAFGGIARREGRSPRAALERTGAGGKIQLALLGARAVALDAAPLQDLGRVLLWSVRRRVEGRTREERCDEQGSEHERVAS